MSASDGGSECQGLDRNFKTDCFLFSKDIPLHRRDARNSS